MNLPRRTRDDHRITPTREREALLLSSATATGAEKVAGFSSKAATDPQTIGHE